MTCHFCTRKPTYAVRPGRPTYTYPVCTRHLAAGIDLGTNTRRKTVLVERIVPLVWSPKQQRLVRGRA
jgi:hypothetical protein